MVKKQHAAILTILAIILTSSLFYLKTKNKIVNTKENTTLQVVQNSNKLTTYNGEYFSVIYPENWIDGSNGPSGNDRTLEQFVIRSYLDESNKNEGNSSLRISLMEITHEMTDIYKSTESIKKDSEINTVYFEKDLDQKVLGFPAVTITQRLKPRFEHDYQYPANFSKHIIFDRNNIRYLIYYNSAAPNEELLDTVIKKDLPVLNQILDSFEFKK